MMTRKISVPEQERESDAPSERMGKKSKTREEKKTAPALPLSPSLSLH